MAGGSEIARVGIIFSGGPAPAANAVIAAAGTSFLDHDREVVGFFHGYSNLQDYHPVTHRLLPGEHYRVFTNDDLYGIRNSRGILIGTSRANPGKAVRGPADLRDADRVAPLHRVYTALVDLGVDALISIGGDDTLKTANYLYLYQQSLPEGAPHVPIVHVPKTIDNDYRGIDFTFGFFTAVDVMAREVQNLKADARATSGYFLVETMGRKAGWLSYGVGIAGEADLTLAVEDIDETLRTGDYLDTEKLTERIVDLMVERDRRGKHYGVVVLSEGLAELLPPNFVEGVTRDEHGHLSLGKVDLGRFLVNIVGERYASRTGRKKKITGVQLGYESRCAPPHAFDVMLGSQSGIGAYRALVEEGKDGHMVSVSGQLDLQFVPFADLIDPVTLRTDVRFVRPKSDFHRLVRFLETRASGRTHWEPPPRKEVR